MDVIYIVYRKYGKRLMDVAGALFGLVFFAPLLLLLALLVRVKLGSPVIFSQKRPGVKGKIFKLYKFRSMTNDKDENGNLLPDNLRLTRFGKALRATSLDELPEFWNILKGDMSLVGPRPLKVEYLTLYNTEQARRHNIRPGLTGLAQVSGRNAISWDQRFALDCHYVDKYGLFSDIRIIFKTFAKVAKRSGISDGESETMTPFTGNIENLELKKVGNDNMDRKAKDLVIIGAGGLGREVMWQLEHMDSDYNILGFVDDNEKILGQEINGHIVLGGIKWLTDYSQDIAAVICIGNPDIRKSMYETLKENPYIYFPTIIAKDVYYSEYVKVGMGCIICAKTILTVNIRLGDFVIVNFGCKIAHDVDICDFSTLYYDVNVAGNVKIGQMMQIGMGENVINDRVLDSKS